MSTKTAQPALGGPPTFVRLAADPVRWGLLRELTGSDRAVRELTALVDKPQNLVSYHLRQLREGGLVSARRSSADGRDSYYTIDLDTCRRQLRAAGAELHPGLFAEPMAARRGRPGNDHAGVAPTVLFLCTGNSARSQMAEALLAHMSAGTVAAVSAGSNPKPLHPNAVRVMHERGIDISANRTKHLDEFASRAFDHVITLCDKVREVCPEFPEQPNRVHWSLADPAAGAESDETSYPAFERTAAELETRLGFLLASLVASPTPAHTPTGAADGAPACPSSDNQEDPA